MTVRLAVLGNPVAHSKSPQIHRAFAAQAGIELTYEKILVPQGKFAQTAREFLREGFGCNVTLPCKHDAFLLAEHGSANAALTQAVNTLFKVEGQLCGENTDGPGLIMDLRGNLRWEIKGQRLLVLGAGGAVTGILPDLARAEPECLHVCNRTHGKAEALVARLRLPRAQAVRVGELEAGYDLIISGTSAGLGGHAIDLPPRLVKDGSRCYDLIYADEPTPFMRWCKAQADCETADGLGMLVEQAKVSFWVWFGKSVKTRAVIAALRGGGGHGGD